MEIEMGGVLYTPETNNMSCTLSIDKHPRDIVKLRVNFKAFCSYNLALVLFFYNIEECFKDEPTVYEIDIKNIGRSKTPDIIKVKKTYRDLYQFFPCCTLHEAKYFLRTKMNIDIIVRPVMQKNLKKLYAADIFANGKIIKHKKWSYMFFETPEQAFDEAALYILINKTLNEIKENPVRIGKREHFGTTYTIYINNTNRYFHMIPNNLDTEPYELPNLII